MIPAGPWLPCLRAYVTPVYLDGFKFGLDADASTGAEMFMHCVGHDAVWAKVGK